MRHKACRSRAMIAVAMLGLTLAGCGKKAADGEAGGHAAGGAAAGAAGGAAVDAAPSGDMDPRPGAWETHMRMENVEMPNMPAQMREMIAKNKMTEQVGVNCLTAEKAKAGKGAIFKQIAPDCKFENFAMSGGHIDATLHCQNAMGDRTTILSGTYGADAYKMHVTNTGHMARGEKISTSMTISAKRVGECPAPDAAAVAPSTKP